jgi:Flp pilus assembly protein TadD
MNLALCYEKLGELAKAKEAMSTAIKLEPQNPKFQHIFTRLKNLKK